MKKSLFIGQVLLFSLIALSSCEKADNKMSDDATFSSEVIDNSRVNSFLFNSQAGAQSVQLSQRIMSIPSLPSNAINMVGDGYQAWKAQPNVNYYIPANCEWSQSIQLRSNTNYYVKGSLELDCYGEGGVIYVLPGGTIKLRGSLNNVSIVNYGDIVFPGSLSINSNASLINGNTHLKIKGISIQGVFESAGEVSVEQLSISGTAKCDFASCLEVSGTVDITNSAIVKVRSCLTANELKMSSSALLQVFNNSFINIAHNIEFSNPQAKIYNVDLNGSAVVACGKMVIHQDVIDRLSGGTIDLHAIEVQNNTGKPLRWTANVIFNGSTYIEPDGCHPGFGVPPVKPVPEYNLLHVAELTSPNSSNISATSIEFFGGKVYVSWHKAGALYEGYIDVFSPQELVLRNTFRSSLLDFDHLSVQGNDLFAVGGRALGAFYMNLNSAIQNSVSASELIKINGASGNCLVKDGENLWVVSGAQGGITILPSRTYIPLAEAKYVVKVGDEMVVLAGIENSKLYHFALNGELRKSYSIGSISPKDGKNTIVSDGETLYVALGHGGIKAVKNGVVTAAFNLIRKDDTYPAANCVDVDDRFVYAAFGNAGLYILNKSDLSLVKYYTLGGASANFVKHGADGQIYVAYGLKGVHLFKLEVK